MVPQTDADRNRGTSTDLGPVVPLLGVFYPDKTRRVRSDTRGWIVPTVQANGIDIEYDSVGPADAETVLLVSGLGVQMIRWTAPFCQMLSTRGFRVVRFDNRDAGLSTHLRDAPVPDLAFNDQSLLVEANCPRSVA